MQFPLLDIKLLIGFITVTTQLELYLQHAVLIRCLARIRVHSFLQLHTSLIYSVLFSLKPYRILLYPWHFSYQIKHPIAYDLFYKRLSGPCRNISKGLEDWSTIFKLERKSLHYRFPEHFLSFSSEVLHHLLYLLFHLFKQVIYIVKEIRKVFSHLLSTLLKCWTDLNLDPNPNQV